MTFRRNGSAMVVALSLAATGCMFKVEHRLPPHSYLGRAPAALRDGGEHRGFEREGMKNWLLAGIVPYTRWGTRDLLRTGPAVSRIEDLEIETRFSRLDTLIWVVPGFAYGYYVWAPRTIKVQGTEVLGGSR